MAADSVELLDRFPNLLGLDFTPESAKRILKIRADASAQRRMDELAERCNEGLLTPQEKAEYGAYVLASSLIATLQAQARRQVGGNSTPA